jgi:hypothetical protein
MLSSYQKPEVYYELELYLMPLRSELRQSLATHRES